MGSAVTSESGGGRHAPPQSVCNGHSPLREYAFLIAHSMLHLLGYDHMEEQERLVMEKKQNEILERLGISRFQTANEKR